LAIGHPAHTASASNSTPRRYHLSASRVSTGTPDAPPPERIKVAEKSWRGYIFWLLLLAMLPLAVVLGLPVALVSAIAFAWVALRRKPPPEPHDLLEDGVFRSDVQPFR
jgi:hypothetical protein